MSENFTNRESLLRYLDGELAEEQVMSLEKQLASDASLRQKLENLRLTRRSVQLYGLHQQVRAIHGEMMAEVGGREQFHPVGRYRKIVTWVSRAAAIVVVALGLSILYQYITVSADRLFRDNFHSFTLRGTRGRVGSTHAAEGTAIREAYVDGRMQDVTRLFGQLPHPAVGDYFLAGNAFLIQDRPADAIRCLLAAQQLNSAQQTHLFEEDIEYYLAMSYLRNGQIAGALPIFEKIHDDPAHAYHDKAGSGFLRKLHWLQKGK
ncbi:MAG: hypothetical protein Q8937_16540 [Bacteroidota bacterium]|nr:hypothetical protein [Bacteroidota bacterium]MDP4259837.1 hypothetical protein [Bacteroidota bacterium]